MVSQTEFDNMKRALQDHHEIIVKITAILEQHVKLINVLYQHLGLEDEEII